MREVIPKLLWFGNALDARDTARLYDAGVVAIVDLAYEEVPELSSRDMIYCRFPLVDGDRNIPAGRVRAMDSVVFTDIE